MITYLGDFAEDATVYIMFNTFTSDDPSASSTITNFINTDVHIHKDDNLTQRNNAAGITVSVDFDGITGSHMIKIDTSDDTVAAFWVTGSDYFVRIEGTTIDGATINSVVGQFSIENRYNPVTDYDPPTKAEMDTAHGLLATEAKQDVIDGIVDAIKTVTDNLPDSGALNDLATVLTDTNEIQGKLPTNYIMGSSDQTDKDDEIDAVKAKTDNLPADPASETNVDANETKIDTIDGIVDAILIDTAVIGALGAGLTAVPWNAAWDAEVQSEVQDALEVNNLDHLLKVADNDDVVDDSVIGKLAATDGDWSNFAKATDSLQSIRDRGDAEWTTGAGTGLTSLATGTAQAGAAGTITLAAGASATSNLFNGCRIATTGGTGAGQSRMITAYDGGTKIATIAPNWTTNPANDTTYEIQAADATLGSIQNDAQSVTDLKDFADAGYDPGTNKIQGVVLVDTTTTNTDMVTEPPTVTEIQAEMEENGASILDSISDKLPTNYIMGSSDQTDKDDEIDAIKTVIDNLPDSGALNDLATLAGRLTAARAGYLDELAAANIPADVDTLLARLSAARAGYLDELGAANIPADIDTLLTRITAAVALASVCTEGRLSELDAGNIPADLAAVLVDTTLKDKWVKNRIAFSGTSMTLYDDDNSTPLLTWTLSQGSTSVSGPYNRAKAT